MDQLEKETPNRGPSHSFAFGSAARAAQTPAPADGSVEIPRAFNQSELAGASRPQPTEEQKAKVMAGRQSSWDDARRRGEFSDQHGDEGAPEEAPPAPGARPRAFTCRLVSNGLTVRYGPPNGNLNLILASILGVEDSRHWVKQMLVRTACCIQAIEGKEYSIPKTWVQCANIGNILGERGIDELILLHDEYWPQIRKEDLPNVRLIF